MTYLTMTRGDDRDIAVTATEDMTGMDVRFTAKRYRRDTDAVIEKSTDDGIVVDGTTATITLAAADTSDLDPVCLFWDIEVVAGSEVHTVADGRLAVKGDITRPVAGS